MVYKNLKTKELVQLIFSNNTICVIVNKNGEEGTIFNGNKRAFKKFYKKDKTPDFIDDELKSTIFDTVQADYAGITEYPDDYTQWSALMWQREDDFKQMLEELKD